MTIQDIGSIGELIAAVATVITLAYLAIQVRSARDAAADTNRLNRANGVTEMAVLLATHPDVLRSLSKAEGVTPYYEAFAEQFELDVEEAGAVNWIHCHTFWMHWGQYSSSTSSEDLAEIANVVSGYYRNPAVRFSWDHSPYAKPLLDHRFVEFVERTIAANEGPT